MAQRLAAKTHYSQGLKIATPRRPIQVTHPKLAPTAFLKELGEAFMQYFSPPKDTFNFKGTMTPMDDYKYDKNPLYIRQFYGKTDKAKETSKKVPAPKKDENNRQGGVAEFLEDTFKHVAGPNFDANKHVGAPLEKGKWKTWGQMRRDKNVKRLLR